MLFLNNAIFRGAGDAAIAMRLLWVSNIINLILDPLLIFGLASDRPFPHLGVTGAALATFTGRSIGVLYQFYRLLKGSERIRVLARHLRLNMAVMLRLLRVSLNGHAAVRHRQRKLDIPGAHRLDLRSASVAGYTVAIRIVVFFILPSWGLSNAAATLVGQNLARQARSCRASGLAHRLLQHAVPRRHRDVLHRVRHAGGQAVRRRSGGHSHRRDGAAHLRLRQHRLRLWHGHAAGVQRAGDTFTPTIVNFFGFWVLELPLAWALAVPLHMRAEGAFLAIVIAECSMAAAGIILFRQGRWKKQQI